MVQRKKTNDRDPVRADRAYSSLQLCYAANISPLILRAAVRDGLLFTKIGGCRHYTGEAWIEYLRSKQTTAKKTKSGS